MTDDALPIWATNLRALREGAGLTSREVSARLGMAATTYATWEQGRSEPRFSALLAICDLFSVTPNDILVGPQKDDLMQALRRSAQARKLLTAALDALR